MTRFIRPSAAGAAGMAMALVCAIASGQTMVDMRSQARNIDFSAASSTRPFPVGTSMPPICSVGQTYFQSDAKPGHNLYLCTATNIWTPIEGAQQPLAGSSASVVVTVGEDDTYALDVNPAVVPTQNGNNAYTGRNDFSRSSSLQVVVSSTRPPNADCDAADEVGRVVLRKSDPVNQASILYLCQATGPSTFGWRASNYSYGSGRPQSCEAGELFFDIGAPAGQEWSGCVSAGTWRYLGSGGSTPSQTTQGGKLLGTNGTASGWRSLAGFTDDGSKLMPDSTVLGELGGNNLWSGHQYYPASPVQTLTAPENTITCNQRTVAISAATPLTLTSAPTIPAAVNGQVCVIVNTGQADITIQDQDSVSLSNLQLTAPRITIPAKGQVTLQFSGTVGNWIQDGVTARPLTGSNGVAVTNGVAGDSVITMPGSSKGDLIVHDGTANTRLGAGASGDSLVVDPAQPGGLKWSTRNVAGANGVSVANGNWLTGGTATITMPGSSKGDLIVHDGTANTRLGAGASGDSLVVDPTQAAGMKWAARSIAGANGVTVTNGNWSTSGAATITMPGNTKGDVIVHNGSSNTRLGVGSDGQVIMADSTQAMGIKWGTVTGTSGGAESSIGSCNTSAEMNTTDTNSASNGNLLCSMTIPAGTFQAGDWMRCEWMVTRTVNPSPIAGNLDSVPIRGIVSFGGINNLFAGAQTTASSMGFREALLTFMPTANRQVNALTFQQLQGTHSGLDSPNMPSSAIMSVNTATTPLTVDIRAWFTTAPADDTFKLEGARCWRVRP